MKKLKYILIFILGATMFTSCFDDEALIDLNDDGNNVAGFTNARENVSRIASGDEYQISFKMTVTGPTLMDLTNDVTVSFAATAASTAIEGVHYRLDSPTTTLTKANNYLGTCNITMLTDGIIAPLAESPILVLQPTTATGDGKVVASGKPVTITLNYACFSDLSGDYTVVVLRDGGVITPYTDITITETGIGEYRTSKVGHWDDIGGTPGYTFYDVCGVLSVPPQLLVETYGNIVEGVGNGSIYPITGVIHILYSITSDDWSSDYDSTYTPV